MRVLFPAESLNFPSRRRGWVTGTAGAAVIAAAGVARAAPVDFSTFQPARGIPAATFGTPTWQTPDTYNNMTVPAGRVATESTNSDTTFFYGPPSLTVHNTVIIGDIYAGTDDDYVGLGIGLPQTATENPLLIGNADYLLLEWKGANQTFNYADANPEFPFHNTTPGGSAPVGLSLSRVTGVPTADEFWQRANLPMTDANGQVITPDSGGLVQLGRGATLGSRAYNRANRRQRFEIIYTPTNIQVFVNGSLEFNVDAPPDNPFPQGTLGLYEQGQDSAGLDNAYAFFDVREVGTPAPSPAPNLVPPEPLPFFVANVSVPEANTNAGSTWQIDSSTPAPAAATVISGANVADVELAVNGTRLSSDVGVLLATVRQNGPRANGDPADARFAGVEAPSPSGFGLGSGLATYNFDNGGEWNVNVAAAHFSYSAGFRGGYVSPTGALTDANVTGPNSPYTVTQRQVPLPTRVRYANDINGGLPPELFNAGNQQYITNVRIAGENSNTGGLLFTIGTNNEDNYTSVSPLADGSWNVAVRDANQVYYGGADTFERDGFAFVYLESSDLPGSVGGRVTGLGPGGVPTLAQNWGNFSMVRVGAGRYQVTVAGGPTYDINILENQLSGDLTFQDVDTDGDGTPDDRVFTDTQDLTPTPVDSSFSFAYVPLSPTDISDGMLLLMPNDSIALSDGTVAPLNYFMTYEAGVPIPEPAASGLLAGAGGLLLARRRRAGRGRG